MVEREHPALSLSRQCRLLSIGRSSLYYEPKGESAETLALMRRIDDLFLKYPFSHGARRMVRFTCAARGYGSGDTVVAGRLMRLMGLRGGLSCAADQRAAPRTPGVVPVPAARACAIERSNHVWCADITDIPVQLRLPLPGGDYGLGEPLCPGLAAVEHAGRKLLHRGSRRGAGPAMARRRSSTPTRAASSPAWRSPRACRTIGVRISMDGRGRFMDNVRPLTRTDGVRASVIERLWRSLKCEAIYLHEIADGFTARRVIGEWIRLLQHRETAHGAGWADAGRGIPGRPACRYDGQAAARLAHISTGAAATARRSIQEDSGGLNFKRNTP